MACIEHDGTIIRSHLEAQNSSKELSQTRLRSAARRVAKTSVRLAIATLPRRALQLCLLRARNKRVYIEYLFYLYYDVKERFEERL